MPTRQTQHGLQARHAGRSLTVRGLGLPYARVRRLPSGAHISCTAYGEVQGPGSRPVQHRRSGHWESFVAVQYHDPGTASRAAAVLNWVEATDLELLLAEEAPCKHRRIQSPRHWIASRIQSSLGW